jgi:simple sugar transport system permease protein
MDRFKIIYDKTWSWIRTRNDSPSFIAVYASIAAIVIGILFGFILMLVLKPADSFYGLSQLLIGGLTSTRKLGDVFYNAAPLIMTGLAVGFAFKTGLFNIGTAGQYAVGGLFALFSAIVFGFPWWLALIASAVGGAIWGSIPGFFKAYFNVNEVISSIMLNWIGMYAVNLAVANTPKMLANYYWKDAPAERTPSLKQVNPGAILPKLGLEKILHENMSIAIFLAIFIAIIIYIILNDTVFGYELKAVGYNRHASRYAGISEKRNIVLSMTIAGALAGIGSGLYYLTGVAEYTIGVVLPAAGFNGIPVALLASSNPAGTIFSGLFIAYTQVGGNAMQPEFAREVADIVIAVVIYISAFSLLFKEIITKRIKKKKNKQIEKSGVHTEMNAYAKEENPS